MKSRNSKLRPASVVPTVDEVSCALPGSGDRGGSELCFPAPGMKVMPSGLPLMLDAWQGFISFATTSDEICDAFVKESGFAPPRSPIDRRIDTACGRPAIVFAQFCDFATSNYWGIEGVREMEEFE